MPKVFISYAHGDWDRVEPVIEALEKAGITCHYDKRDYLSGKIDQNFAKLAPLCDFVVLFTSAKSCSSQEVWNEYSDAISWSRSQAFRLRGILPVRLDDTEFESRFLHLSRDVYYDLRSEEEALEETRKLISAIQTVNQESSVSAIPLEYYRDAPGFILRTKVRYMHYPLVGRHPGIAEVTIRVPSTEALGDENEESFIVNLARPQDSPILRAWLPWWTAAFEAVGFRDAGASPYTKEREEFEAVFGDAWRQTSMLTDIGPTFPPQQGAMIISGSFAKDFAEDAKGERLPKSDFQARMKTILDADKGKGLIKACDAMFGVADETFIKFSADAIVPACENREEKYIRAVNFMIHHLHQAIQAFLWCYFRTRPNPYVLYPVVPGYFAFFYKTYLAQFPMSLAEWFDKCGIKL